MILSIRLFFLTMLSVTIAGQCYADTSQSAPPSLSPSGSNDRPTFKSILRRCSIRQKEIEAGVSELSSSLDKANNSNDLAEVRKMIEETRKKLAEIKVANSKSSALIEKAEKHLEKISQKAEVKTSDLIDQPDSDLDEVIWAF